MRKYVLFILAFLTLNVYGQLSAVEQTRVNDVFKAWNSSSSPGAALGIIRLRPAADAGDTLRTALRDELDPEKLDGIISMHLIEGDPVLSRPISDDPSASNPGAGDWFILIDATHVNALPVIISRLRDKTPFKSAVMSSGVYKLMWDLAKNEIPA